MTVTAGRLPTMRAAGLSLALLLLAANAHAQASVPIKQEAAVSVIFQHIRLGGHFDTDGSRLHGAVPSEAHLAIVDFEYGLTDKLAFNVRLPYVASRYTGSHDDEYLLDLHRIAAQSCTLIECPKELTTVDTGAYYSTFQDFGLTFRYNLLEKGLVVTPLIGASIPSHDYRTVGEASAGQNRLALHTGVNLARVLDPVWPGAYVHARYMYSFVQGLYGLSLDRSNADFEVGYAVMPTVSVRALGSWQHTHGGIGWGDAYSRVFGPDNEPLPNPDPQDVLLLLDHDRLLASRYWHLGGGATVSLTDSLDLDGAVLTFVSGADSHYGVGLSVGLTWRLAPGAPAAGLSTGFRRSPSSR